MSSEPAPPSDAPAPAVGFASLGSSFVPPEIEELQGYLPHLEIQALIGHGGMGTFYRARQPQLDRLAAVKVLPIDPDSDGALIQGFKREAKAMAALTHPNIIGIYDFGETASLLYLVMEFVEGDLLERRIDSRPFELGEIVEIVAQICEALGFAHRRGVVHRDLRPGNTFLSDKGDVKVGDFGLARLIGDELFRRNLTEANHSMGSLDYVAPEQYEPGRSIDHRADIYSVGMMLYKLLTGTLPRGTFVPPTSVVPELDPRLDHMVIRCMQRNPDNRYQAISEVAAEVRTISTSPPSRRPSLKFNFPSQ